jgi:hypothetical protein
MSFAGSLYQMNSPTTNPSASPIQQPSLQEPQQPSLQEPIKKVNACIAEFTETVLKNTPEYKKQQVMEALKKFGPVTKGVLDAYTGQKKKGMFSFLSWGGRKTKRNRRRRSSKKMKSCKTCKR